MRIRFSDDVNVLMDTRNDRLKVGWKDVVIAEDYDRFVPFAEAIHAYSRDGGTKTWKLPAEWRNAKLEMFTLTKRGRGPAPAHEVRGDTITLELQPHTPVKIVKT